MKPGPQGNVVDIFAQFINSPYRTESTSPTTFVTFQNTNSYRYAHRPKSESLVQALDLATPHPYNFRK